MTIYRGYDIKPHANGGYEASKDGEATLSAPTEEAAMDAIDIERRKIRGASDRPVA